MRGEDQMAPIQSPLQSPLQRQRRRPLTQSDNENNSPPRRRRRLTYDIGEMIHNIGINEDFTQNNNSILE